MEIINFKTTHDSNNIDLTIVEKWIDNNCIYDKNYVSSTVDVYNYFIKSTNIKISQTKFILILKKTFKTKRKTIQGKKYTIAIGLKLLKEVYS